MAEYSKGDRIGAWELVQNLGKGGNGEVWRVRRGPDVEPAAMKILCNPKPSARKRFEGEIRIHGEHGNVPGVLLLLDVSLPNVPTHEAPAYFVMPLAERLDHSLPRDMRGIVEAVTSIADTLTTLHGRGVAHRDIKPANLLMRNNLPRVGDFGIAEYPDQPDLTDRSGLGPKWTIAPEMKRSPDTAAGPPADVYSLAKTLWIMLTRIEKGFEGSYIPGRPPMALSMYWPEARLLGLLEKTLERATANIPEERPSMAEFATELREWLRKSDDYWETSLTDWRMLQNFLFPRAIPERAVWRSIPDIVTVLNLLGHHADLNHIFHPDGGGLDLEGAAVSAEPSCIELQFNRKYAVVVQPRALFFEAFQGLDDWTYFRLEIEELAPSGVYPRHDATCEEVLELAPRRYVDRSVYDQGFLRHPETGERIEVPPTARIISRQFRGAFVIFAKASVYNEVCDYMGGHAKVDVETFRRQIEGFIGRNQRRHHDM